jgi:hypothetical protein
VRSTRAPCVRDLTEAFREEAPDSAPRASPIRSRFRGDPVCCSAPYIKFRPGTWAVQSTRAPCVRDLTEARSPFLNRFNDGPIP